MNNLTDKEFELIRDYIKKRFGINLSDEKKTLVYSRLRVIMEELKLDSFEEYYKMLFKDKDGDLNKRFIDRISTNHTFFMREKEHFEYFAKTVLPYIEERHATTKDIRLWCAACSSGEEAYTLQIILQEYFANKPDWNLEILATDISNNVLNIANDGIYATTALSEMPTSWIRNYFEAKDQHTMVAKKTLKDNITFSRFNFIEDQFNFRKPFQVIFCRNVMIYFDQIVRSTLVNKFYSISEEGAYLFVGQSESLSNSNSKYEYVMPAVYRKPFNIKKD